MRWVDQASVRPFRCAVVPYIGNGRGNAFIDTGQDLDLEHVYISDAGAEAVARMLGWVPPGELRQARAEVEVLKLEVERLQEEVREADRFAEAAEYTLGRFGQKVQRKPGRPKKKVEEVVA